MTLAPKKENAKPAAQKKVATAPKKPAAKKTAEGVQGNSDLKHYNLRLYVAGQTSKSVVALNNLQKICEQYLKDRYTIEVIDLVKKPQLAKGHQILAIPTLVREIPAPLRKIIGDLSNFEKVLVGLDIQTTNPTTTPVK